MSLRYGSVCSGIEAATMAWHPLGWEPVFFSEIEKFPCAALVHHYPHVPNHGDMTKFQEWPDHAIDLLVGGTPCQSFSVAGLRAGLADPRGNLMLTYLAIAARYRPRWLVWENVPGVLSSNGGRDFGTLLRGLAELGYGFAYRVLDAQFCRAHGYEWAVPQRRRRVFVVGYLGDWRRAAAVLFDGTSLRGDSPPRREAGKATPAATAQSTDGCCSVDGCDRPARKRGWCNTHYQRWRKHGFVADTPVNEPGRPDADRFWEKVAKSDGCWEWTAALNEKGYGVFWSGAEQRLVRAHRFSYEQSEGEIPEGLELDHTCRNRKCVRPDHLEPVTGLENTRRGNAGKHWAEKRGGYDVAPTISARTKGGCGLGTDFDLDGGLISNSGDVGYCLTASAQQSLDAETETLIATGAAPAITSNPYGDHESREGLLVAHALRGEGFDASEDGTGRGTPIVAEPIVLMERGRGDGPNLETRQDGTANAILTPNGGRGGLGVGAVAYGIQAGATREKPSSGPDGVGVQSDIAYTVEARAEVQAVAFAENSRGELRLQGGDGAVAPQLTTGGGKPGQGQPCVAEAWAVRRLTPRECERLQGFPDNFTAIPYRGKPAADGPRYKSLGNSMAVNVMRAIGERIALVDKLHPADQRSERQSGTGRRPEAPENGGPRHAA